MTARRSLVAMMMPVMSMERGGVHPAQQADGLGQEVRHRHLPQVERQAHRHRKEGGFGEQLPEGAPAPAAGGQQGDACRPEQDVEKGVEDAGVQQPLGPEQGFDQGEAHVPRVGKGDGKAEQGAVRVVHPAGGQQGDAQAQPQGGGAGQGRPHQVGQDLGVEGDQVGIDDHGGDHQVDQQGRKALAGPGVQDPGPHRQVAGQDQQEHDQHLLRRDGDEIALKHGRDLLSCQGGRLRPHYSAKGRALQEKKRFLYTTFPALQRSEKICVFPVDKRCFLRYNNQVGSALPATYKNMARWSSG